MIGIASLKKYQRQHTLQPPADSPQDSSRSRRLEHLKEPAEPGVEPDTELGFIYCPCARPDDYDETMISCEECERWFHAKCTKLQKVPQGGRYCQRRINEAVEGDESSGVVLGSEYGSGQEEDVEEETEDGEGSDGGGEESHEDAVATRD